MKMSSFVRLLQFSRLVENHFQAGFYRLSAALPPEAGTDDEVPP
jgi:hypothetical protein